MSEKIRVGSRVQFQNLVATVVGRDGNAWSIKPNGTSQVISVPENQLSIVMNEGHMESSRMEDYRNSMLYD